MKTKTRTITIDELAIALQGIMHAQSWWAKQGRSKYIKDRRLELDAANTKFSEILDAFSYPEDMYGEKPDNGREKVKLMWQPKKRNR